MTTLTVATVAWGGESARKSLGPFELGMTYDAWNQKAKAPSMARLLKAIRSSKDGTARSRTLPRVYQVASGGVILVELEHRRCGRLLNRVTQAKGACTFWFAKTGHDQDYRLFQLSVHYDLPRGISFGDLVAKYTARYGAARFDQKIRQPASDPASRSVRWAFRTGNLNYTVYLNERSKARNGYRLELSTREPYLGGTRYGRHLRRTRIDSIVLD